MSTYNAQEFVDWVTEHRLDFESRGIEVRLAIGPEDHNPNSMIVDLDSDAHSGRIVVWADGQTQLNSGNTKSKEVLLDEYRADIMDRGIEDAFESVLQLFE